MGYYLFENKRLVEFYQRLFTVDVMNKPHYFEHSFTFLHWSLIE